MKKVKIISGVDAGSIEDKVNDFLYSLFYKDGELIDFKFSESIEQQRQIWNGTAIIIYKESKK